MKLATVQRLFGRALAALASAALISLGPTLLRAQEPDQAEAEAPRGPWNASGRVTDQDGRPLAGVEVRAHCGYGTLRCTGVAASGADGRYALNFGTGILYLRSNGPMIQAARISARKSGYFEVNLNRQGGCRAADAMPGEEQMKLWDTRQDRLFLPDHPLELNFVMRPAGRVAGKLVDERGQPLAGYSVALVGAESNVLDSVVADDQGRFALEDVPTTFQFQFAVRKAHCEPPWDDSWASAALQFDHPLQDDLHAWFGNREIRLQEFVLRVAGPGMHQRTANSIAGNVGVLVLTTDLPGNVQERSDTHLAAKSAVLTLRNSSRPDLSESLVKESVPAPAVPSPARLTRTRPNGAGEFTISFENPRGFDLVPGKHQVIFQVFVGVSQKPIRERIFRQLEVHDGRYEIPVKIAPEWLDDSHVSITFVTIQPDHAAWVKAFFDEGNGTSYSGIWAEDGDVLPAISFEARGGR